MKVIDISMTIRPDMEIYPGDTAPEVTRLSKIEDGDPYNVSQISIGTHTGTHVDPPLHFLTNGNGIDRLPVETLVGQAKVLDISSNDRAIEPRDLGDIKNDRIILFKGKQAHLTVEGAQYLVDNDVGTVGTEALSIASPGVEKKVHHILLAKGIVIIEGLDLSSVDVGYYFLVCLPLKITDGDGGPARAVLISGF